MREGASQLDATDGKSAETSATSGGRASRMSGNSVARHGNRYGDSFTTGPPRENRALDGTRVAPHRHHLQQEPPSPPTGI